MSIFLNEVDDNELTRIIYKLSNSSPPGWDRICAKVVTNTFLTYTEPLVHILNLSLTQGVFSSELKVAHVIPIFKGEDAMKINNYRPVSVLPLFSKIFERVMYDKINNFITKNNILYKYQFGFREGHGTNMALIVLMDKILNFIDSRDVVLGVFLDFSKAFDTVDHKILLEKLYKYEWIKDYLHNRQQYVTFKTVNLSHQYITCGVPQGSILEPLLFILFIIMILPLFLLFFFLFYMLTILIFFF